MRSHTEFFPASAQKAHNEEGKAADPVDDHSVPDAECAEVILRVQKITDAHAADKHGGDRNDHGKFYIVCRPQKVRNGEGKRPDQHADAVMHGDECLGKCRRVAVEMVPRKDGRNKNDGRGIEEKADKVLDGEKLFRIIFHAVKIVRADALPDDRDGGKIHGGTEHTAESVQIVRHGVCRRVDKAVLRYDAHDQKPSELKNAVFNSARNPDCKNAADQPRVGTKTLEKVQPYRAFLSRDPNQHKNHAEQSSRDRSDRGARNADIQNINEIGVADDVDDIAEKRGIHTVSRLPE